MKRVFCIIMIAIMTMAGTALAEAGWLLEP